MYKQCVFKKENTDTTIQSWITVKHAKKGKFVQLIGMGDDFWEVVFVGDEVKTEDPSISYRTWNNNI